MSNKIYVGNLSFNTLEDNLKNVFEQFGSVVSCKVIMDRMTERSKGFAFVEMMSATEAKDAISNLDGSELNGRNIRVNEAKPEENRERTVRTSRW